MPFREGVGPCLSRAWGEAGSIPSFIWGECLYSFHRVGRTLSIASRRHYVQMRACRTFSGIGEYFLPCLREKECEDAPCPLTRMQKSGDAMKQCP